MRRKKIHHNHLTVCIVCLLTFLSPIKSVGATWADSGVYSINWFNKNESTFDISTPQEFAGIAYLVNNNFTDFSGKTIYITADIDLKGKNWIPIGTGSTIFKGSIDGNGPTISNINISSCTSNAPYASGIWINMNNASIKNINFKGNIDVVANYIGFLAYKAESSKFENIGIECVLSYYRGEIHTSTDYSYDSKIAGMICESSNCSFTNIRITDAINYNFGDSYGNNCYGYITLYVGGIVSSASNCNFIKCHSVNKSQITISGYETTSTYTNKGDSFITYGGIVGSLKGNSSKVVGCLAENKYFIGDHNVGTFDTKYFRFGGIAGYISKYDYSTLKNCVAINGNYSIYGHDYSWQAAWYHTNSYFGGIAYEVPKNFGGCYSNNDVIKNINKVGSNNIMENGSTSFSTSQMNSQSFVDELNFYSQLEFDEDYWILESGRLGIRQNNTVDEDNVEALLSNSNTISAIYSLSGRWLGQNIDGLSPGIYVIKTNDHYKKIIIK